MNSSPALIILLALLAASIPGLSRAQEVPPFVKVPAPDGSPAEPDFLFVINRFNGKTAQKIKLASGPDDLILKDGHLYVRCYNRDYVFEVTP